MDFKRFSIWLYRADTELDCGGSVLSRRPYSNPRRSTQPIDHMMSFQSNLPRSLLLFYQAQGQVPVVAPPLLHPQRPYGWMRTSIGFILWARSGSNAVVDLRPSTAVLLIDGGSNSLLIITGSHFRLHGCRLGRPGPLKFFWPPNDLSIDRRLFDNVA